MANLQYRIGGSPYVWVVKGECGCDVFFDFENALNRYNEEFKKLQHDKNCKLCINVAEDAEKLYYAVFIRNEWCGIKRIYLTLDDKTIIDGRKLKE